MEQAMETARKRVLESYDEDGSPMKRMAEDSLHLKILIPR